MYTKGHTKININIEKIKSLPYQRYEIPNYDSWPEAKIYPKEILTDALCSDVTAENKKLEWGWTDTLRITTWKICALSFTGYPLLT